MARKRRRRVDGRKSCQGSNARRTTPSHGDARAAGGLERAARAAAIKSELQRVIGPGAIEIVPAERVRPNPRNARRHSDRQIEQIAASIRQFGFLNPIVIDETDRVLAGHGRLEAARQLNLKKIPCVRVDHLTPEAKRAYALADNRLAELSDWDEDLLAAQLEELSSIELDFEVEITGFDTVDQDRLRGPEPDPRGRDGDSSGLSMDPDDQLPPFPERPVSRPGDLWLLGAHRVLCGDALEPESYAQLLRGEKARQVVSDPPFNVPVYHHVTSKAGFREFPMASGEMSREGFIEFLTKFLRHASGRTKDGAILHVFIDWRHLEEMLQAARVAGLVLMNLCVWCKPQAGMGSFYRSQMELVLVLKSGSAAHLNTFGLGARGRNRSNIWRYPSVRGPRRGVNAPENGGHPTVKPVSLVIDAIRDSSHRGDIILDPFGGSGTTLIAAERIGRRARLIELDPAYVDLTVRRWQTVFGRSATLAADGRTFDEVAAERRAHVSHGPEHPGAASDGGPDDQEL